MLQGFRYIYRDRNDQKSIIRPDQTPITLQIKKFKKTIPSNATRSTKKSINGKTLIYRK